MIGGRIPQVGIVMSSSGDLPRVEAAGRFLRDLDIPFEMTALSAYATPDAVREYGCSAACRGYEVILAASGGCNALASMIASYTTLPIIALPLRPDGDGSASKEFAALLSSLETPPGIPIATVGFNDAENAGCLAAQILGVKDRRVRAKLEAYREECRRAARLKAAKVAAAAEVLQATSPLPESLPAFPRSAYVASSGRTVLDEEEAVLLEAEASPASR